MQCSNQEPQTEREAHTQGDRAHISPSSGMFALAWAGPLVKPQHGYKPNQHYQNGSDFGPRPTLGGNITLAETHKVTKGITPHFSRYFK